MATIGERIIAAMGGITTTQHQEAIRASEMAGYASGFSDGNDDPISGDLRSFNYRSTSKKLRDFSGATTHEMMETAWKLWQSSPVAKRILTLKRDHIAGRNISPIITGDDDAAEIVQEFWSDNELDKRSGEFTLQLFAIGEQCYSVFVRESDGRVRLGYIDPMNISKIVCNPMNDMDLRAVIVGDINLDGKILRIVRKDEEAIYREGATVTVQAARHDGLLVTAQQATLDQWEVSMLAKLDRQQYDGTCFFAKVNSFSNQERGVSDLIQVADWIDQADETLFALGDREQYADFFSWDVTLEGASPEMVAQRQREIMANPPKKGSINVHNDAEEWKMQSPDLRQEGSITTYRALLGLILGGVGFPVHWFGYGDDANRATALAQGDPTIKSLGYDQSTVRDMFTTMLQFVVDQADIATGYTPDEDLKIAVNMPELSTKDLAQVIPLFGPFAIALLTATESGWMTHETAAGAWAKLMGEFGVEIDPTTELEAVANAATVAMDEQQGALAAMVNGAA